MMNNKKPEIRFKGFSEEWEKKELGKVGKTFTGLSGKTKDDFGHGIGKFVTYMNVYSNSVSNPSMTEPIEIDKKQNEVKTGDVFFTTSSETIEEVGMSSVWLDNTENVYLNSFCFGYRPTENFDNYYLAYMLRSTVMRKKITFLGQGISRYNISKNRLLELTIPKPTLSEQTQLGNFFKNLDSLITLHQQKYDKLVNVKKVMLEKMFPKNGADIPEIRFKGFSGAWEERTLGDLFGIASASRVHKHEWTESGVPFFRSSDVVSDYKGQGNTKAFISFELYEELSKKSGCVQKNDILVTGGGSIGIPYLVKSNEPLYFKDADLLWLKNSDNMNGYFLYTFFSTSIFRSYVNSITHIGTISHYTIEQAKATPIKVPKREEQDKIGEYLKNLDNLLTLHQGELGKLKNLKKAMLEKMFV